MNRRNGQGQTPLHLAVMAGYEKMVKLLLDKGARVDKCVSVVIVNLHLLTVPFRMTLGKSPQHPLHLAAAKGNTAIST